MRPDRFERILVDVAPSIPGVNGVKTLAEAGHTAYPYGVAVEAGGRAFRWQVVATSAPGESYAREEAQPRLGEPLPKPDIPPAGSDAASIAKSLVLAVVNADPGEIRSFDLYADRPTPPAIGQGATFEFYDGSRIFLNAVR